MRPQPSGGAIDHDEYDLLAAPGATYLRLAGKRFVAGSVDMDDLRVENGTATVVPLEDDVRDDLDPALELLRTLRPPGFLRRARGHGPDSVEPGQGLSVHARAGGARGARRRPGLQHRRGL